MKNLIYLMSVLLIGLSSCRDNEQRGEEEVDIRASEMDTTSFEDELEEAREDDGIVVAIEGNPELSTFATGINAWNIGEELNDDKGPFTIFAPSNTAYSMLYQDQGREVLRVNNDAIIEYHIIPSEMSVEQLKQEIQNANGSYKLTTMNGQELTFSMEGEQVVLKDASGDTARVTESSSSEYGTIHIIDKVLLPTDLDVEIEAESADTVQ